MKISIDQFKGLLPLIDITKIPENASTVCRDVDLSRGSIVPYFLPKFEEVLPDSNQKSIYLYRQEDGTKKWLSWESDDIDIVNSPVNDDKYERVFYSGAADGKIHQYGTFGDRVVSVPEPPTVMTVTVNQAISYTLSAYVEDINLTKGQTHNFPCSVVGHRIEAGNIILNFNFPGIIHYSDEADWDAGDVCRGPVLFFRWTEFRNGYLSNADYGASKEFSYAGVPIATPILESITGNVTFKYYDDGVKYLFEWTKSGINVVLNANFEFADEYRQYAQTFVNDIGQEGPVGPITDEVRVLPDQYVSLSSIPTESNDNVISSRIYRTSTASNAANSGFQLVDTIPSTQATYDDLKKHTQLGMSWAERMNPPDGLRGLVFHPARFLAAFKGDTVYLTERYLPHSWNHKVVVEANIVGLAVSGNDIVVLTESRPTILSGTNPERLSQAVIPFEQGCVSKRGITILSNTVVYPSPDGICSITGGVGDFISKQFIHPNDWRELGIFNTLSLHHDDKIFMWLDNVNFVLDLKTSDQLLSTVSQFTVGGFNDLFDDTLYYINGDSIFRFDSDLTATYEGEWHGRCYDYKSPLTFSKCRVLADGYPVFLDVYCNEVLVKTMTLHSDKVFNLPIRRRDEKWSFSVRTNYLVRELRIGQSTGDFLD